MAMLDKEHPPLPQNPQDNNVYTLGEVGEHNVVIACLPSGELGNNSAAAVAVQMRYTFSAIRFGLMVGIGGGVPSTLHDIRLGDVVVSNPGNSDGGVIQYDFGRTVADGVFKHTGALNSPPTVLLTALSKLRAKHNIRGPGLAQYMVVMETPFLQQKFTYQGADNDKLYRAAYDHPDNEENCDHCDENMLVSRPERGTSDPVIHYGTIASGNQVMRHGGTRDRWGREAGVLCFEMEAAGLMKNFPCLVIRGICDYADTHKNKMWQEYAAATAAAFTKELLSFIPHSRVTSTASIETLTTSTGNLTIQDKTKVDLPFDKNKNYVQRSDISRQLEALLEPKSKSSPTLVRVALYGLGGSGKTQIASWFAETYQEYYTRVFWINGAEESRLVSGFSKICKDLELSEDIDSDISIQLAQKWLTDHQGWLLVIDNLDEDSMIDMLPGRVVNVGMKGTVLITSRNERVKRIWNAIEVSNMAPQEATTLLSNIIGQQVINEPGVDDLLNDLGYLPLAVDQVASYISYVGMSVSEYHGFFKTERHRVLKMRSSAPNNVESQRNVMTTWEISFNRVQQDNLEASVLFLMLSLLYHEDIPLTILESALSGQRHWAPNGEFEEVPLAEQWIPRELRGILCDKISLWEAVAALKKFSLVLARDNSKSLYVHPLVLYWASDRLAQDLSLSEKLKICVIGLVSSTFEKQDRLPPLSSRNHLFRRHEEYKLRAWPWRQYPQLKQHALSCLRHAMNVRTMPESAAHLCLSLLQVLEYSTFGSLDADQELSLSLIDHVEKFKTTEDDYLECSALIWRLTRLGLCPCRKSIYAGVLDSDLATERGVLCAMCRGVFSRVDAFLPPIGGNPRMRCILMCLAFWLEADRCWIFREDYSQRQILGGKDTLPSLTISFYEYIGQISSWMLRYGLTFRQYLIIRSENDFDNTRGIGGRDVAPRYLRKADLEALNICEEFRALCGGGSEEYRRSVFYACLEMSERADWQRIEELVYPLVLESIEHPVQSWSHERCIIRYIEALLEQKKDQDSQSMLKRIADSYANAGKRLITVECSPLMESELVGANPSPFVNPRSPEHTIPSRDIQIFVKGMSGRTLTINTNTCATVRSVMQAMLDKYEQMGPDARLIYASKQLDPDRFLSDYNIQQGATLWHVLRLCGGIL